MSGAQVIQTLCCMHIVKQTNSLEFYQYEILYQQVGIVLTNNDAIIFHVYRILLMYNQA